MHSAVHILYRHVTFTPTVGTPKCNNCLKLVTCTYISLPLYMDHSCLYLNRYNLISYLIFYCFLVFCVFSSAVFSFSESIWLCREECLAYWFQGLFPFFSKNSYFLIQWQLINSKNNFGWISNGAIFLLKVEHYP